jgi:hypothetical protein
MSYAEFLARKTRRPELAGHRISATEVHPMLHGWQSDIVRWAVRTGRAAVWADTGLGKTFIQLEWARLSGDTALIVAPLAVCQQTVREAAKVGIDARYVRHGGDISGPGIWVTNYEMVDRFDPSTLDAVVLDESSILKQSNGKTRTKLIRHFASVPRRLACTATPAPNDSEELTNQAEFLGVTTRAEMLAAYFVHDSDGWRPKGHARAPMYRWMAEWAIALRRPSDLGYPDDGYVLPALKIVPHLLPGENITVEGQLFGADLGGVGGRAKVRQATLVPRCEHAAGLVAAEPDEPWLLWCGTNDEANLLTKLIPNAVNIHGSLSPEEKAAGLLGFADGTIKHLVTKPKIASFGMNWQRCARMAFVGLSDSFEQYYQGIRRCWRFGQTRPVQAHVVLTEVEAPIAANIARKEAEATATHEALVAEMRLSTAWSAA